MSRPLVILGYPKIDHEKDYVYFWMPFSLLTVARSLREIEDVDVVLFDGNQQSIHEWETLVKSEGYRALFVGLSIMTGGGQIAHALTMAQIVKDNITAPVVLGGPHVNVLPEQTADHGLVDVVLTGPGQTSVSALAHALLGRRDMRDVPGLVRRSPFGYERGPANPPKATMLGSYPWDLLDVKRYIRNDPTVASRTLNYVSSQGCIYQCRFCYELTYDRKWSSQPTDSLVEDVRRLASTFDINGIKFYDADWFINLRRSEEFCDALIADGPDLRWAASINPNDIRKARRLRPDLLKKVAKSGCSRLLMGVESGSDRVLAEIVNKEITSAEIFDVAREIADNGIMGSYTFIVGFPGETDAEVDETYCFLDRLRSITPTPETRVHLFAPYPGTPLYERARQLGFAPPTSLEQWSRFDYYDSQTPWTSQETVRRARQNTHMILNPKVAA